MTAERPRVSVILPTYNRAGFLPGAVASVRDQRYDPLEIIVVDDGSTDDTERAVAELRADGALRYLRQDNAGPSAGRNAGLAVARGDVIAFIDADDLWPAGKLACQLRALADNPLAEIVIGRTQAMRLVDESAAPGEVGRFVPFAHPWHSTQLGGALYRRDVFARVGLFDTALRLSEDLDWFLRARECGVQVALIDAVTLLYRFHHDNVTRGTDPNSRNLLLAVKRSLDRRRSRGGLPAPMSPWSTATPGAPNAPNAETTRA